MSSDRDPVEAFDFEAERRERSGIGDELDRLREQRQPLFREYLDKRYPPDPAVPPDYDSAAALQAVMNDLEDWIAALHERRDRSWDRTISTHGEVDTRYRRPDGWFVGLVNRPLGPPAAIQPLRYSREEFRAARSHPWLVALSLAVMVTTVTVLVTALPASATSPTTLVLGADFSSYVVLTLMSVVIGLVVVQLIRVGPRAVADWIYASALAEEQWFRSGAERWSWAQRLYSCVAFGAIHVVNLIYTVANLAAVAVLGGVLLGVYLRRVRGDGDQRAATIEAAKLHAQFNMTVIAVLVAPITLRLGHLRPRFHPVTEPNLLLGPTP